MNETRDEQINDLEKKLHEIALALQYVLDGISDHHILESDNEKIRQFVIKARIDAERIIDINTNLNEFK